MTVYCFGGLDGYTIGSVAYRSENGRCKTTCIVALVGGQHRVCSCREEVRKQEMNEYNNHDGSLAQSSPGKCGGKSFDDDDEAM
mmetsp:Transcript_9432/g.17155  ORF Transcript_9432/g.17155 Transcript_9432/m.17155 type:complete len:84 (-) Transcript_9432:32-283(-)